MDKNTSSATPSSATPATKRLFRQYCDKQEKALKTKLPFLTSAQINAKVKKKWLSLSSDRKLTTCQELSKYPLRNFIQKNAQDPKSIKDIKRRIFVNSAYFRPRMSGEFHIRNELAGNAIHGRGEWKAVSAPSDVENRHESEKFDSSTAIKETNQTIEQPNISTPILRRSKRLKTKVARTASKLKSIKESKQKLVSKKGSQLDFNKGKSFSANFKLRKRLVPASVLQEYEFDDGYKELGQCSTTNSPKDKLLYMMPMELIKGIETWQNNPNEFNKLPGKSNLQNVADSVNLFESTSTIDGSLTELYRNKTYQFSSDKLHFSNSQGRTTSSRGRHDIVVNGSGDAHLALDLRNTPKRFAAFHQDIIGKKSQQETRERGREITRPALGRLLSLNNLGIGSQDTEEPSSNDLSSPDKSITGSERLSDHSSDSSQDKDAVFIKRSEYPTHDGTQHLSDFSFADNAEEAKHDKIVFCDTTFSPDHYPDTPSVPNDCQNTTSQLLTKDETLGRGEMNFAEPRLRNPYKALKIKKLSCTADFDRLEVQDWAISTKNNANGKEMSSDKNQEYDGQKLQSNDLLCDMFQNVFPDHGQSKKRSRSRVLESTEKAFNNTSFNNLFNEEHIFL